MAGFWERYTHWISSKVYGENSETTKHVDSGMSNLTSGNVSGYVSDQIAAHGAAAKQVTAAVYGDKTANAAASSTTKFFQGDVVGSAKDGVTTAVEAAKSMGRGVSNAYDYVTGGSDPVVPLQTPAAPPPAKPALKK